MNSSRESVGISILVRIAVVCALIGLFSISLFLWFGFAAWSAGVGIFFGTPLLVVAMILYIIAVVRDLRQQGVL